jgi:hypothetical protein
MRTFVALKQGKKANALADAVLTDDQKQDAY